MASDPNKPGSAGARAERFPDVPQQRAALFGRSAARYAPVPQHNDTAAGTRQALEEDNDRMVEELSRKVSALKSATITIHDEVSDHNRMLNAMSDDFDRTGNLMTGTLGRLDNLLRTGGSSVHMCTLILFVVAVFLVLWWLISK